MKIEVSFEGAKGVNAMVNGHLIKTDQPVTSGGTNSAPTPFELFLASLATCAGIYVKGFCDQRNLPTENIKIFQDMQYDPSTQLVSKVTIEIQVPSDFPEKYHDALIAVANKCKVKQHLHNPPVIETLKTVI
jgi:ribosomal protein S12 methylthiotransferase accessory factor